MGKKILARLVVGASVIDDGTSALQIAGAERLVAISTPSVPDSGNVLLYGKRVCGRTMPHILPDIGTEIPLQSALWKKQILMWTATFGAAGLATLGVSAFSFSGTGIVRTYASNTVASRSIRCGIYSGTGTPNYATYYWSQKSWFLGDGSTLGKGFFISIRFSVSDAAAVAGARMFVGLYSGSGLIGNAEPSTFLNCIGVAQLSTDNTQLYLVYGGTTAQIAKPLGTNFPIQEAPGSINGGALYDVSFYSNPNSNGQVSITVDRVGTPYSYSTTIQSSGNAALLPTSVGVSPYMWRTNNATAQAVALDINRVYIEQEI